MNKIISLTKVLLKNSFQKYSENNKKTSKVGKIILYGILLVYLMGIFGFPIIWVNYNTTASASRSNVYWNIFIRVSCYLQ